MEIRTNGTQYKRYKQMEKVFNESYDYENKGLLKHLMSRRIIESEGAKKGVLKYILEYFEKSMIFLMKYTDELKNFKNIHYKNR